MRYMGGTMPAFDQADLRVALTLRAILRAVPPHAGDAFSWLWVAPADHQVQLRLNRRLSVVASQVRVDPVFMLAAARHLRRWIGVACLNDAGSSLAGY